VTHAAKSAQASDQATELSARRYYRHHYGYWGPRYGYRYWGPRYGYYGYPYYGYYPGVRVGVGPFSFAFF
jgi:hypothetical protein